MEEWGLGPSIFLEPRVAARVPVLAADPARKPVAGEDDVVLEPLVDTARAPSRSLAQKALLGAVFLASCALLALGLWAGVSLLPAVLLLASFPARMVVGALVVGGGASAITYGASCLGLWQSRVEEERTYGNAAATHGKGLVRE